MNDLDLPFLRELARRFPTIDSAVAEIAALRARLTLPKGTVHVLSDIHGEDKKLRHVLSNAAGTLRPLCERVFEGRVPEAERLRFLSLVYYPGETLDHLREELIVPERRAAFVARMLDLELEVLRALARGLPLARLREALPEAWRELFCELVLAPALGRPPAWLEAVRGALAAAGKDLEVLRLLARAIRNLTVAEVIVAGDMGDRGPRIDRVIGTLMRQPDVSIVWGNHDASWMGACLGDEACVASVLRISLRHQRLGQLIEGYGISLAPLEELAHVRYGDDPAERFVAKSTVSLRDPLLVARMQKAAAMLELKLEGQLARRSPELGMENRCLLHRMDLDQGTIELFGHVHPLLDRRFPTLARADPYALDPAERKCMDEMRALFLASSTLWEQMLFLFRKGSMYLIRDGALIFHGCVPVEADGTFQSVELGGRQVGGRALFDACRSAVQRAWRNQDAKARDLFYWLWAGARSPLFGKDKMTTFERYFIEDERAHRETKNAYFELIHDAGFCREVLEEFGVDPETGMIVNGHVPVKVDEVPIKRSGKAITIDGAFAAAYGDRGYTLVLGAERSALAEHHPFDSVEEAVARGRDIVPVTTDLRRYEPPRTTGETDEGAALRAEVEALEKLVLAYRENVIAEAG